MKNRIYQNIIIALFLAISFIVAKNDITSALGHISSSFDKGVKSIQIPIKFDEKKEVQLPSKVDMPGALRVVNGILNINGSQLSKSGIIKITNQLRAENGNLKELKENESLDLSAEKKLQDMFDNQYFEHKSPKGVSISDLADQVGYKYILIGENLAMGNFKDDAELLNAWMASEGHRANILNKYYTEIGVAVGRGSFNGKDVWMAVQHFGAPRNICPNVSQVLYVTIGFNQDKIEKMKADLLTRIEMINRGALYEGNTYDEQIDKYNSLIGPYNSLIIETKKEIDDYNNQIRLFNKCLLDHQQ